MPAGDLAVLVFNPSDRPPAKRVPRARPPAVVAAMVPPGANAAPAGPSLTVPSAPGTPALTPAPAPVLPKFTKQQIVGRLRQLKLLYEDGLLTDEFYDERVAECETAS